MPCTEGPRQAAQSSGAATKEPRSNEAQSKDSATRRKDAKDGKGKHAKMWRRIEEASTRDEDLSAKLAKLSTQVAQMVAYLGSNELQARDNGSLSEAVAGVEATKGFE